MKFLHIQAELGNLDLSIFTDIEVAWLYAMHDEQISFLLKSKLAIFYKLC
jgi:hypothetical protein